MGLEESDVRLEKMVPNPRYPANATLSTEHTDVVFVGNSIGTQQLNSMVRLSKMPAPSVPLRPGSPPSLGFLAPSMSSASVLNSIGSAAIAPSTLGAILSVTNIELISTDSSLLRQKEEILCVTKQSLPV